MHSSTTSLKKPFIWQNNVFIYLLSNTKYIFNIVFLETDTAALEFAILNMVHLYVVRAEAKLKGRQMQPST